MDRNTLKQIERDSCCTVNAYTSRDINGKLIQHLVKDENGEYKDITAETLFKEQLAKAEEDFRKAARANGVSEADIELMVKDIYGEYSKNE